MTQLIQTSFYIHPTLNRIMWATVFIMLLWITWVFTNYLYQLHEHHPILEVMSEVCDRFQAWFPLQLRVHPGNIGCQLLLQPVNHTHTNPNNPQRNTCTAHITEFREGKKWGCNHESFVWNVGPGGKGRGLFIAPLTNTLFFYSIGQLSSSLCVQYKIRSYAAHMCSHTS